MKEKYCVLLMEDDESARTQLATAIIREGFEVKEAENGKIGLEIFKAEAPEIVISDIDMPEVDGMEVLKQVKQISPNTPFILITGQGGLDTVIQALQKGVLDYIKKPIDLDQLFTAIGRAKEIIDEEKKAPIYPGVLVVEDDNDTREGLIRALEKEDWGVFAAENGETALNIFREQKIDVALLDINMPKKSGLEVLSEMRNLGLGEFEAIVLTGYGEESNAIQALRDGAMNFLKKPVDLDQLVICVEKAVEKLNLTRGLKFRTREVELSKQLLAKMKNPS